MSNTRVSLIQPQVAQLDLQYPGPLDIHSVVETIDDLLLLKFNYKHRRVWVKSESTEYYLAGDFDGTQLNHWKPVSAKVTIEEYSPAKKYAVGDIVVYKNSGKLYKALDNVPIGEFYPHRNPRIWGPLIGDIETHKVLISNESEKIVTTDNQNPMFRVYQNVQTDNGLAAIEIDCVITEILNPNEGTAPKPNQPVDKDFYGEFDIEDDDLPESITTHRKFKFEFIEDGEPKVINGFIIVK